MKPLIMLVEDNEDVIFNIKYSLERNGYNVISAKNGKDGIRVLSDLNSPPDIIISDILMPEMDGYDFFKFVAKDDKWFNIPFIFLTALSSEEDVRLGKMLGVDDYIVKPFTEEDLLSIISGKLARKEMIESIRKDILQKSFKMKPSISNREKEQVFLTHFIWDRELGPDLRNIYPKKEEPPFPLKSVGVQLFHAAVSIFGQYDHGTPQGLLLKIENIGNCGYIFFDVIRYKGETTRFMLAIISPKINYFESLKIKKVLGEIADKIKNKMDWNIQNYWEKIVNILSSY